MTLFKKKITSDITYKDSTDKDIYFVLPSSSIETNYYFLGINVYTRVMNEITDCKSQIDNTQNKKLGFK